MNFINLTPHAIKLNACKFPPSGELASVDQTVTGFDSNGIAQSSFGNLQLPEPREGVIFIASMLVAQAAAAQGRTDVVAPATRHDETRRNEAGHILSVPGFLRF